MTPGWVAVCCRRRLLASRHLPSPFSGTLALRRRRCPSASHPLVPSLPLPGPSLPRGGGDGGRRGANASVQPVRSTWERAERVPGASRRSGSVLSATPPPHLQSSQSSEATAEGPSCPGDGLLPVPLTRCIQMHRGYVCPARARRMPGIQMNVAAIYHNASPPNITPSSSPETPSTSIWYDCWRSIKFPFFHSTNGTITCTLPL